MNLNDAFHEEPREGVGDCRLSIALASKECGDLPRPADQFEQRSQGHVLMKTLPLILASTLVLGCSRHEPDLATRPAPPQDHSATHRHTPPTADALGGPSAGSQATQVQVVNGLCPILVGQSVGKGKMCDRTLAREFKGQMIGFCDPECRTTWDQLTDEQRQAYLDEAMALEAKDQKAP